MNLYIETENNQPKNHPAFEDNLLQAFGAIPEHWVQFIRVEQPIIQIYEIYEGLSYELIDGVYTDVHHIRPMTDEEKLNKQNNVKAQWNNRFPSWNFDETICTFRPPVEYPQDGKHYYWDEPTVSWVEIVESQ